MKRHQSLLQNWREDSACSIMNTNKYNNDRKSWTSYLTWDWKCYYQNTILYPNFCHSPQICEKSEGWVRKYGLILCPHRHVAQTWSPSGLCKAGVWCYSSTAVLQPNRHKSHALNKTRLSTENTRKITYWKEEMSWQKELSQKTGVDQPGWSDLVHQHPTQSLCSKCFQDVAWLPVG